MNSQRMNSTKPLNKLEEAERIQHLVWTGFDTWIYMKNLTEEDRAELYTIYQENFNIGYIPED